MSGFKVKFIGSKKVIDHFEYIIQVDDITTAESWVFNHRYSALRTFYTSLKKFSPGLNFPQKKFFGSKNSKFIEKRKLALETFFSSVMSDATLSGRLKSLKFLKPEDKISKTEKMNESKRSDLSFSYRKTADICLEIVSFTGDKYLDFSEHPGSVSDEEILIQKEMLIEKCKDIKFKYSEGIGNDENFSRTSCPKSDSRWLDKAFETCLFNFKENFCKLNG